MILVLLHPQQLLASVRSSRRSSIGDCRLATKQLRQGIPKTGPPPCTRQSDSAATDTISSSIIVQTKSIVVPVLLLKQWRSTFNAIKFRLIHLEFVFTSMGLVLLLFAWMLSRRMLPLSLRKNRRPRFLALLLRTCPCAHHCMRIKMHTVRPLPDQHVPWLY
jgi:hypothetical protein